ERAAARTPGKLLAGDLESLPFADRSFQLVYCCDVLEHVRDDRRALIELFRVLAPGGRMGLVVPAFQCLWTQHDEANHHHRRYRRSNLVRLVRGAGFTVVRAGYLNVTLGVPVALYRLTQRLLETIRPRPSTCPPRSDIRPLPRALNGLLSLLYRAETALVGSVDLPLGTSVMLVLSRPAA
ncbi:MAG: class I SAM-dependent methyltransferase, partial [Candidatus Riflebacteria bacterium]|nr:class I SAM-dependent methyltransferase [Candidatus Riflebacteria bacterium]